MMNHNIDDVYGKFIASFLVWYITGIVYSFLLPYLFTKIRLIDGNADSLMELQAIQARDANIESK